MPFSVCDDRHCRLADPAKHYLKKLYGKDIVINVCSPKHDLSSLYPEPSTQSPHS